MKRGERPYPGIAGFFGSLVSLLFGCVLSLCSQGQSPVTTRTYDTLLTGNGYGNYHITFPQWNPDSGMLVSAKINARVTLHYGFTVRNVDVNSSTYTVSVGREDQISGPALGVAYDSTMEQRVGSYPLDPGNSVTLAPFTFLNNYNNTDSITGNTAPFMGAGAVNFTYSPFTFADIRTANNASYFYGTNLVLDTIHFSLTYLYSPVMTTLATTLVRWDAIPQDPSSVALSWAMANEQPGEHYEIQAGRDGQVFTPVADLPAVPENAGVYSYIYRTPENNGPWPGNLNDNGGKWYFRLKIKGAVGDTSWSGVIAVDLGARTTAGMKLYPNPASNYVYLAPGNISPGWRIDILSADGRLVQSHDFQQSNGPLRIDFREHLPSGVYFIHLIDLSGHKQAASLPLTIGLSPQ
jgi:hypothetical protein